ncbi:hypothetical protein UFOVP378_45 [uncultured Caudovirales phage]|uniref:Uncharacterized protein n=1 Tax=uncultured Caudovirales phage TaxID=2100421 RepID=A0A6J7X441_9CAUD|nr:hypothetical protein UFOVP378_45 [uncultured Caudovirales phage]
MTEFEYNTTLNGGVVTVVLNIEEILDEDGIDWTTSFQAVYFDCTDVTSILSKEQLNELEMAALAGFSDYCFDLRNV